MSRYVPIPALCSHSQYKNNLSSSLRGGAEHSPSDLEKAKRSLSGSSPGDAPECPGHSAWPLLGSSQVQQDGVGHLHRLVFDQDDVEGVQVSLLPLLHLGNKEERWQHFPEAKGGCARLSAEGHRQTQHIWN